MVFERKEVRTMDVPLFLEIDEENTEEYEDNATVSLILKIDKETVEEDSDAKLFVGSSEVEEVDVSEDTEVVRFEPVDLDRRSRAYKIYVLIEQTPEPLYSNTVEFLFSSDEEETGDKGVVSEDEGDQDNNEEEYEKDEDRSEPQSAETDFASSVRGVQRSHPDMIGGYDEYRDIGIVMDDDENYVLVVKVNPPYAAQFTLIIGNDDPKLYEMEESEEGIVKIPLPKVSSGKKIYEVTVKMAGYPVWTLPVPNVA